MPRSREGTSPSPYSPRNSCPALASRLDPPSVCPLERGPRRQAGAVDDMTRFRSAKKFARYTGLIPSTYASNARVYHGPLTKQGNKWLRWAFIEAVGPAIRASSSLRRYHDGIKARRGAKDARVCTARKLAELAWTVWTERRCYEERPARTVDKVAS